MEQETHNVSSRKGRRKISLFLFGAVLFSGALYAAWLFLQKPAVGVVRVGTLPTKEESFAQGTEQKHFSGKYFSFSYTGTYEEKNHTVPVSGVIKESVFLSANDFEGRKIAIGVEEREERGLAASPSFQMRMNDPKTYARSSATWGGLDMVLFTKNSQVFEQTVFFQKDNLIVSVSATSPLRLDALSGDLDSFFQSFEWKQK